MQYDLGGKVLLVTGGVSGIGLAVGQLAERNGARVAVLDKRLPAAGQPKAGGSEVLWLEGDVSQEAACENAVSAVVREFGRLDILVNNAGIFETLRGTVQQELSEWRRVIDVNLQGSYLMARAAIRAMNTHAIRGSIVNVASINGVCGFRASNAYGVSKAAVAMLTKTLALDVASRGIRVNAVAPGFIETPMTAQLEGDIGVSKQVFERRTPMGRFGTPAEIANVVMFLASDLASFMTGTVIPVDGGWSAFGGPGDASRMPQG